MKTALVLLTLLVLLGGCTATPAPPSVPPSPSETSGTSSSPPPSPTPSASPSPSPTATSASPTKVPPPDPGTFSKGVTYADGLKVEIVKTKHSKLSEEGGMDGNLAVGVPLLIVSVRVTNGTGARISLDESDAQLRFAGKKSEAAGVDDVTTDTLYGHLKAGATKTGKYGFAEPKTRPDSASVKFSVDSRHPVARFKGPFDQ